MSIPEYARTNFDTLLRAAARRDLALVECADMVTDEPRYVICAIGLGWRAFRDDAVRSSRNGQPLRSL